MAFNLGDFNFNQSVFDSLGHLINIWAYVINRVTLSMEAIQERNFHNYLLDLA